eukprot:scaffold5502_cov390-Prasinococcus_capsulatus_cf.AAC.4
MGLATQSRQGGGRLHSTMLPTQPSHTGVPRTPPPNTLLAVKVQKHARPTTHAGGSHRRRGSSSRVKRGCGVFSEELAARSRVTWLVVRSPRPAELLRSETARAAWGCADEPADDDDVSAYLIPRVAPADGGSAAPREDLLRRSGGLVT